MRKENAAEFLDAKDRIRVLDCISKISLPKLLQDFSKQSFQQKLQELKSQIADQLLSELSKDLASLEPSEVVNLVVRILAIGA